MPPGDEISGRIPCRPEPGPTKPIVHEALTVILVTREQLKGQNLSFTEIAKIVGENWQHVSKERRERFESQAQQAKDKYRRELAEYKKTPEHETYSQYLQDFKKRQEARGKGKHIYTYFQHFRHTCRLEWTIVTTYSRRNPVQLGLTLCSHIPADLPKGPAPKAGRNHRGSTGSIPDLSNRARRTSPYQIPEPASPTRHQGTGSVSGWSEPHEQSTCTPEASTSPVASTAEGSFGNTNLVAQSGPHPYQKLPSLSDVLDDRVPGGCGPYLPPADRTTYANYTLSRRPAIPARAGDFDWASGVN